jgi:hypothetical protein
MHNFEFNIKISLLDLISFIIAFVPLISYAFTNHWILNNLIGIIFSVSAINVII